MKLLVIQGTSLKKGMALAAFLVISLFLTASIIASMKTQPFQSTSIQKTSTKWNGELLYQMIGWENHALLHGFKYKEQFPTITSLFFQLTANIHLNDPRSLLGREMTSFSLFDGKIVVAGQGTNYANLPVDSEPPKEVLSVKKEAEVISAEKWSASQEKASAGQALSTGDRKVVYLYFTHTRESFLPYLKGVDDPNKAHHSKINVTKIGDFLKEELEKNGIGTIVDKTDITGNLQKKGLSYRKSYDESRNVVVEALAKEREVTYLFDIHRDSRRKKDTTIKLNGKNYAKLAFVIGGNNPKYERNLKLAKQLHKRLEKEYPGLSRGVIEKKGKNTNGKFNQDLSSNALLIEFGGVDNTFEELNRTADAVAKVFSEIYWDAEKVDKPIEKKKEI